MKFTSSIVFLFFLLTNTKAQQDSVMSELFYCNQFYSLRQLEILSDDYAIVSTNDKVLLLNKEHLITDEFEVGVQGDFTIRLFPFDARRFTVVVLGLLSWEFEIVKDRMVLIKKSENEDILSGKWVNKVRINNLDILVRDHRLENNRKADKHFSFSYVVYLRSEIEEPELLVEFPVRYIFNKGHLTSSNGYLLLNYVVWGEKIWFWHASFEYVYIYDFIERQLSRLPLPQIDRNEWCWNFLLDRKTGKQYLLKESRNEDHELYEIQSETDIKLIVKLKQVPRAILGNKILLRNRGTFSDKPGTHTQEYCYVLEKLY